MERFLTYENNEAIQYAHSIIPQTILDMLHFDYLIGYDPIWIGFHNYENTSDGRSYRKTACVAYPFHQLLSKDKQKTTIILPQEVHWRTIIHEVGHVLDECLGFTHLAEPISEYAKTNGQEAFAEAFKAWLIPNYATIPLETQSGIDDKTLALFESLAWG